MKSSPFLNCKASEWKVRRKNFFELEGKDESLSKMEGDPLSQYTLRHKKSNKFAVVKRRRTLLLSLIVEKFSKGSVINLDSETIKKTFVWRKREQGE